MTSGTWGDGVGLGRAALSHRPAMVLYRPGSSEARLATVGGKTFCDLPALLDAAAGQTEPVQPGDVITLHNGELMSPVGRPRKIICVGQNYDAHIREAGRTAPPGRPDLFAKWDNALAGPYADIALPPESDLIDYESELVVVIGRRCRRVETGDAGTVIFGYTAANDGSVRDYQLHTTQRTAGKAWDGLTPLGPVVVPAGQLGGDRPNLRITGHLNGEIVQDGSTGDMVYGIPELISYITTFMTLEAGDLILTGTPAGVGFVRTPPRLLSAGDEFEVRIEGIGTLCNRYYAEKP